MPLNVYFPLMNLTYPFVRKPDLPILTQSVVEEGNMHTTMLRYVLCSKVQHHSSFCDVGSKREREREREERM